jgi:tetratricopeptide (TPR) repeat protein
MLPALYDEWLTPLREGYRRQISDALQRLALLFEEQKRVAEAIACAERLVALDALCESHHQLLIRLHAANHDRASALRAYHQCMRVLRRELGVEPGAATQEMFDRILKEEPGAAASPAAKPVPQLQKQRALVGRAREWHQLASARQSAVEDGPRVAVISGEPGIGKTGSATSRINRAFGKGLRPPEADVTPDKGRWPMRQSRNGSVPMQSRGLDEPRAAATHGIIAAGPGNL